jgi:hypothetical protein
MSPTTSPAPVVGQGSKLQKKSTASKALQHINRKLRGKDSEQVQEDNVKHIPCTHPESQLPSRKATVSVDKQLAAKSTDQNEEDVMDKLRNEYREMERGMSLDTVGGKMDNLHLITLEPYEPKLGTASIPRQAMTVESIPQMSHLSSETKAVMPASLVPGSGTLASARTPFTSLVDEPEDYGVNVPRQTQSRPSHPQQSQNQHIHDSTSTEHKGLSSHQSRTSRREASTENKQISPSYEKMRSDLEVAQFEKEQFQRQLENVQKMAHERNASLVLLQKSHDDVVQELHGLRLAHDRLISDVAQLGNLNSELEADVLSWQTQFDIANNELLQLRSNLSNHVSDKWFQTQWKDMHVKIENLSNQYFVGRLSKASNPMKSRGKGSRPDRLENQPAVLLARLTNENARYLASDRERTLIIQAFIWWILINRVFAHTSCDDQGFYWAGQSRELLYHLKRQIRPPRPKSWSHFSSNDLRRMESNAKNYHQWRATTSMLLLSREPVDKRINNIRGLMDDLITDVFYAVSPYIVVTKQVSLAAAETGLCSQLEAILLQATETDAQMAQQRAWIYCEQWRAPMEGDPQWGFKLDSDEAEIIETPEQAKGRRTHFKDPCVEMIIQPALIREGNQYGQEYATREVLCKAKVVVGESTFPPIPHR